MRDESVSVRIEPKPSARRVGSARMFGCGLLKVTAGIMMVTVAATSTERSVGVGDGGARVKAPKKGNCAAGNISSLSSSAASAAA
jgi:hypothetical protein